MKSKIIVMLTTLKDVKEKMDYYNADTKKLDDWEKERVQLRKDLKIAKKEKKPVLEIYERLDFLSQEINETKHYVEIIKPTIDNFLNGKTEKTDIQYMKEVTISPVQEIPQITTEKRDRWCTRCGCEKIEHEWLDYTPACNVHIKTCRSFSVNENLRFSRNNCEHNHKSPMTILGKAFCANPNCRKDISRTVDGKKAIAEDKAWHKKYDKEMEKELKEEEERRLKDGHYLVEVSIEKKNGSIILDVLRENVKIK